MAKSKSAAFFPTYTLASWLRLLGLRRKEILGPTARFPISRHLQKNPTYLILQFLLFPFLPTPDSIPHQSWLVKNINLWRASAPGEARPVPLALGDEDQ